MERELWTLPELAENWGMSRAKIYSMVKAGEIGPIVKMGRSARIRPADARAHLDRKAKESRDRSDAS
jgi:excisionase family DNA binding protein